MNNQAMLCTEFDFNDFLQRDQDQPDPVMLNHLDECSNCQRRLESLVGGQSDWQLAAEAVKEIDRTLPTGNQEMADGELGDDWYLQPAALWDKNTISRLLAPSDHPEILGRLDRYHVEHMIGAGGMGVVFKAYDTELNRTVAIKMLSPYLANSSSARQRFARESRAAAGVVDDHVVPIHNVYPSHNPPYLVMQYIAGGSLQEKLDRDGPLQPREVVRIGLQIAKGLAAAHNQGLIHRDVKPSNVLLDEGVERAMLTDFGLARIEDEPCLTRTGFHPGTPHYMSPEQVQGLALSCKSDQFGLGCLLSALCTGHSPFRAETSFAAFQRIVNESPKSICEQNPDIPGWLEQIIFRLLSRSPEDRFQSAEQVANLLERCLAHLHQPATNPLPSELGDGQPARPLKASKTRRFWMKAAVGTSLALVFAAGIFFFRPQEKSGTKSSVKLPVQQSKEESSPVSGKPISSSSQQEDTSFAESSDPFIRMADIPNVTVNGPHASQFIPYPIIHGKENREARVEIAALHKKCYEAYQKHSAALNEAKGDQAVRDAYMEYHPKNFMGKEYLAYEKKYRGTSWGLLALTTAINVTDVGGGSSTESGRSGTEVIDRLNQYYVKHQGLEEAITTLHFKGPFPSVNKFWKAVEERNPNPSCRAYALYERIRIQAVVLTAKRQMKFPEVRISFQKAKKVARNRKHPIFARMGQLIAETDPAEARIRLEKDLKKLSWEYSEIKVGSYGTMGNACRKIMHAMGKVVPGEKAQELEAKDLEGKPFKLSDYQGKIVVLLFTIGSQQTDFEEQFGSIRQLVSKYSSSPVRVVNLMCSSGQKDIEAVKKAVKDQHLIWRIVPIKPNGNIQHSWGVEGYNAAFIIDSDGILQPILQLPSYERGGIDASEISKKIDFLLLHNSKTNPKNVSN